MTDNLPGDPDVTVVFTEPLTVQEAIVSVKAALGAIGKDSRVTEGPAKYAYRSIDAILEHAHAALVSAGLVILPEVCEPIYESRTTRNGGHSQWITMRVHWRIVGPRGDSLAAMTVGEAADTSDKATNKAHTAAFKVLLTQLFAIPYSADEQDADRPETGTPGAPPARQRADAPTSAAPEWTAAHDAEAAELLERLENLPGDLYDKAVQRMTKRAREAGADLETFSGPADLRSPAWLPVWRKTLDAAWATAETRSEAPGEPKAPATEQSPPEPVNAQEAPQEAPESEGPAIPAALADVTWADVWGMKQSEVAEALLLGGWSANGSENTKKERLAKKLGIFSDVAAQTLTDAGHKVTGAGSTPDSP